jgi:hypothetical protein
VINMMVAIALTGGLALLTLAIAVGMLQTRSVNAAWARIAVARRLLHERNRWLDEREAELAARQEELDRWQGRR